VSLIPIIYDKFQKIPRRFWAQPKRYLDTRRFVSRRPFHIVGILDHYGTSKLRYEGLEFNLLNDYGDQEIVDETSRIPDGYYCVFTPCVVTSNFQVEVADFIFHPYFGLHLANHKVGSIPEELRKYGIDIFIGKRAFYYTRNLSLRITTDLNFDELLGWDDGATKIFESLPRIYQDVEADKWISSPRVKVSLRKAPII
jgi:hypothetical protein